MKLVARQTEYIADAVYRPRRRSWDRLLAASVCFSLLVHFAFVYASRTWKVADIDKAEQSVETLFKVQLTHLESRNFLSRPTQEQLIQERERVLREEMESLSNRFPRSMQTDMDTAAPSPPTQRSSRMGRRECGRSFRRRPDSKSPYFFGFQPAYDRVLR